MTGREPQQTVVVIGGPTASGKSGLALALAEALSGIIINGDSIQLYRGLPLLTAQPSPADMAHVPHRLYATLPPEGACSAARWRDMALAEIGGARTEKKLPIVVGGTGFYLKTLLKGISPIPDIPHALRQKVSALQKELGNPGFHRELSRRDQVMAERLHPFNTQRLIRAWGVLEATGKSLAEWQSLPPAKPPEHLRFLTVALLPERTTLYAACNGRLEQMLQAGAVKEVNDFQQRCTSDMPLAKTLGYPELSAYLNGQMSLSEATQKAQQATRHYAKRQVTWFRHQVTADLVMATPDSAQLSAWVRGQL